MSTGFEPDQLPEPAAVNESSRASETLAYYYVGPVQLDTNVLIALPLWVQTGHPQLSQIEHGEASVCALVWYEFLCGPVSAEHIELIEAILQGRILPMTKATAQRASALFNAAGRARRLRTDAFVAASAIEAGMPLLTLNHQDFAPFEGSGLRLVR